MARTVLLPFAVFLFGLVITRAQEMVKDSEPTFITVFEDGDLPKYTKPTFGEWKIENGALVANQIEGETHHPGLRIQAGMTQVSVLEFEFRFGDREESVFTIYGNAKRQLGFTPHCMWIRIGSRNGVPAHVCGFGRVKLDPTKWHRVRVEIDNDRFLVTLNKKYKIHGKDTAFEAAKNSFALGPSGSGGAFKNIKVWRGRVSGNWDGDLPPARELNLPEFNFCKADHDNDGQLSAAEYQVAWQFRRTAEEIKATFERLDKNRDKIVSRKEFLKG